MPRVKAKASPTVEPVPDLADEVIVDLSPDPLAVWLTDRGFRLEGVHSGPSVPGGPSEVRATIVCDLRDLSGTVDRLRNRIGQAVALDSAPWTDAAIKATWIDGAPARLYLTGVRL